MINQDMNIQWMAVQINDSLFAAQLEKYIHTVIFIYIYLYYIYICICIAYIYM